MKPYYTDLHIHTSINPDILNNAYDVRGLIEKIKKFSNTENIFISLTDHNTINKKAYLDLERSKVNYVVGAELHVKIEGGKKPYHCHIYFDCTKENIGAEIDEINKILDGLYPKKEIDDNSKIPVLENIISKFDNYDFLLLPHAGQSHSPFNEAIPKNKRLDSTVESVIYYNFFDGFTSRNIKGKEKTKEYFKKLGIDGFVNLITCSDNYDMNRYPETRSNSDEFIPTWILAEPSFLGLRLSLSEEGRLFYQKNEPEIPKEYIKSAKLNNDNIDIDVCFTPGLNVVIGGSSTGKTLLVDSIFKKINKENFDNNIYKRFNVADIVVENPSSSIPHYINQNYISSVLSSESGKGIENIDVLCYLFPNTSELDREVENELFKLQKSISKTVDALKRIEDSKQKIEAIPAFPRLITKAVIKCNPFSKIKPTKKNDEDTNTDNSEVKRFEDTLEQIKRFSIENPLMKNVSANINSILDEIFIYKQKKEIYDKLKELIEKEEKYFNHLETTGKEEDKRNEEIKNNLINEIGNYAKAKADFNKELINLHKFNFKCETKSIESQGHKLFIENNFKLNEKVILEEINNLINIKINSFADISEMYINPTNFKKNPKINGYDDFNKKLYARISDRNKKQYKIITSEGKDFDSLSPGWKTAIVLDIIFGYKQDNAPIIIDQPEDNLASNYINNSLIKSIKECKSNHQIIVVTHNATIPMLADAQNIILCRNSEGKIIIRNCPLEGKINNKTAVDYVAEITDGGKPAIKKRYKKYNLKKYREEESDEN